MEQKRLVREDDLIILHTLGTTCSTTRELVSSVSFERMVYLYLETLIRQDSPMISEIGEDLRTPEGQTRLVILLKALAENTIERVVRIIPGFEDYLDRRKPLHRFVEGLYDYWRSFDRYLVCHSERGPDSFDTRPYRTFNATVEKLTDLIRGLYRDIAENITGDHPRIYRQVAAGCKVGLIVVGKEWACSADYCEKLKGIPFIRQVWIDPPLIIDPPMNKRTGQFEQVASNPLNGMELDKSQYLCYPAKVGPLVIFIYFHQHFIGLGCSLANLFELADDEQIAKGPDAVYIYGAPAESMKQFGDLPTVFYDDKDRDLLVAAIPLEDRFGYFGYLKKMVLTLHNIVMMKRQRMPYHGAMVRVSLKNGASANVLLMGDSGTGKSELLEAFRTLGQEHIRDLRVVADDMGSLEISGKGEVLGYGTEVGAFVRLDDLNKGYAFAQIDRAIIMSPHRVNARVIVPVTTLDDVLNGYPVEYILYANNYEQVDDAHPIIGRFGSSGEAMSVFREGKAMAKGTTTSKGMVENYFANIFGPPQYRDIHEKLADRVFGAAFEAGVFVGQVRTRLGLPGYETTGPEEAAKALFEIISQKKNEPKSQAKASIRGLTSPAVTD
jgi:energy-coupling factor transporter ATP-binding protein EcfA2